LSPILVVHRKQSDSLSGTQGPASANLPWMCYTPLPGQDCDSHLDATANRLLADAQSLCPESQSGSASASLQNSMAMQVEPNIMPPVSLEEEVESASQGLQSMDIADSQGAETAVPVAGPSIGGLAGTSAYSRGHQCLLSWAQL
jgi:hypothetical protein